MVFTKVNTLCIALSVEGRGYAKEHMAAETDHDI